MQPSINQECERTLGPLFQGNHVVRGVQLNLPWKFNVINTKVVFKKRRPLIS